MVDNQNFKLFDIVIPLGPNDIQFIDNIIIHCKQNIINYRNIYVITNIKHININDCIIIDENSFPFKCSDINISPARDGWYFQQLLKLYASFVIPELTDDYLIIDADTYFLKPTSFIENGVYLFNPGTEHHPPYFNHMKKLHPSLIRKINHYSGICHHMIFNKQILLELFNMVSSYESNNNQEFWKIFLKYVDTNENSGA